jgi:RNA polymerase subunit RPABC4/transcription elongation factor Spt4
MFLIAGIQPRTRKGPKSKQICPRCGLAQVHERRLDHYFSLFFIPLVRVRKGEAFSWCEPCQMPLSQADGGADGQPGTGPDRIVCRGCGKVLDPNFRFCPHCGNGLS